VSAHHLQIDIIAQCHEKSWTHPDKLSFDSTLLPERQPELHPKLECSHNLIRVTHKVSDHHLEITYQLALSSTLFFSHIMVPVPVPHIHGIRNPVPGSTLQK